MGPAEGHKMRVHCWPPALPAAHMEPLPMAGWGPEWAPLPTKGYPGLRGYVCSLPGATPPPYPSSLLQQVVFKGQTDIFPEAFQQFLV